jgi:putative sigma-54 modulation protein
MDIKITTKNLRIEDDVRDYAVKKLSKLAKYLNSINSIKMELVEEKSKSRQTTYAAQVTLNINGFLIRGEQKDENPQAAIDSVADVMERLIDKYKKRYAVNKGKVHESIRTPAEEGTANQQEIIHVVKRKKFMLKTMNADQAIEQMEFIGHDFFLFVNDEDNSINVIYRRKDGKYGLIQPEFA